MTTRGGDAYADRHDADAMVCLAAEAKLDESLGLLPAAVKGEAA